MKRKKVGLVALVGGFLLVCFVGCVGCESGAANGRTMRVSPTDVDQIERAAVIRAHSEEAVRQQSSDQR